MNNNHQSTNQRNQAEHILDHSNRNDLNATAATSAPAVIPGSQAVDTNLPQLGQYVRGGRGSDGDDGNDDQQGGEDSRKRERNDSLGRDPQDCQDEEDKCDSVLRAVIDHSQCDSVSRAVLDHMRKQSKYHPPKSWGEIRAHMGKFTGPVPSLSYVGKKVADCERMPSMAEVVVREAKPGRWTMSDDYKRIEVLPPQLKKRRIADDSGVTKVTEQVNNYRINMVELGTDDDATDTKIDCNYQLMEGLY